MTEKKKKRNLLGAIIALVILIGFPLGSLIYLREGVEFRKEILKEITVKGTISNISYVAINNKVKNLYDSKEIRIAIVFNLDPSSTNYADYSEFKESYISKLYEQFARRNDVIFLFNDINTLKEHLIQLTSESTMNLADVGFYNQDDLLKSDMLGNNEVVLTDVDMQIRNTYRYGEKIEMDKLVEHIAITIPIIEKKRYKSSKDADN